MKWFAASCWFISVTCIVFLLKGTNQGCSGDCNQGRKGAKNESED